VTPRVTPVRALARRLLVGVGRTSTPYHHVYGLGVAAAYAAPGRGR
jgi:hypothetical protein